MKNQKVLFVVLFIVLLCALLIFKVTPYWVDQSRNTVSVKSSDSRLPHPTIPFMADLHCDALLWDRDLTQEHSHGHVDIPRMQKAGMALQFFSIVTKTPKGMNIDRNSDETDNITLLTITQLKPINTWFNLKERAMYQCKALYKIEHASKGVFRVISTKSDLQNFIQDRDLNPKLMSGMLGIEGAHCLMGDLTALDQMSQLGVRYIGLSHFFDNEFAGSAHGIIQGGLTPLGKELVKKMEQLKITIDLAHASKKTIDDVLMLTRRPLLVSHTGVYGTCPNNRNLSDEHVLEIGKRGGLIGIGLWETAVCGTNAEASAKSIRYVVDLIGVDRVALGSDFDGAVQTHFDVTQLELMIPALKKEGFTMPEIEKIMGGNIRDFFLENLPD